MLSGFLNKKAQDFDHLLLSNSDLLHCLKEKKKRIKPFVKVSDILLLSVVSVNRDNDRKESKEFREPSNRDQPKYLIYSCDCGLGKGAVICWNLATNESKMFTIHAKGGLLCLFHFAPGYLIGTIEDEEKKLGRLLIYKMSENNDRLMLRPYSEQKSKLILKHYNAFGRRRHGQKFMKIIPGGGVGRREKGHCFTCCSDDNMGNIVRIEYNWDGNEKFGTTRLLTPTKRGAIHCIYVSKLNENVIYFCETGKLKKFDGIYLTNIKTICDKSTIVCTIFSITRKESVENMPRKRSEFLFVGTENYDVFVFCNERFWKKIEIQDRALGMLHSRGFHLVLYGERSVFCLNVRTKDNDHRITSIRSPIHTETVTKMLFHRSDENTFYSCSSNGCVKIWEMENVLHLYDKTPQLTLIEQAKPIQTQESGKRLLKNLGDLCVVGEGPKSDRVVGYAVLCIERDHYIVFVDGGTDDGGGILWSSKTDINSNLTPKKIKCESSPNSVKHLTKDDNFLEMSVVSNCDKDYVFIMYKACILIYEVSRPADETDQPHDLEAKLLKTIYGEEGRGEDEQFGLTEASRIVKRDGGRDGIFCVVNVFSKQEGSSGGVRAIYQNNEGEFVERFLFKGNVDALCFSSKREFKHVLYYTADHVPRNRFVDNDAGSVYSLDAYNTTSEKKLKWFDEVCLGQNNSPISAIFTFTYSGTEFIFVANKSKQMIVLKEYRRRNHTSNNEESYYFRQAIFLTNDLVSNFVRFDGFNVLSYGCETFGMYNYSPHSATWNLNERKLVVDTKDDKKKDIRLPMKLDNVCVCLDRSNMQKLIYTFDGERDNIRMLRFKESQDNSNNEKIILRYSLFELKRRRFVSTFLDPSAQQQQNEVFPKIQIKFPLFEEKKKRDDNNVCRKYLLELFKDILKYYEKEDTEERYKKRNEILVEMESLFYKTLTKELTNERHVVFSLAEPENGEKEYEILEVIVGGEEEHTAEEEEEETEGENEEHEKMCKNVFLYFPSVMKRPENDDQVEEGLEKKSGKIWFVSFYRILEKIVKRRDPAMKNKKDFLQQQFGSIRRKINSAFLNSDEDHSIVFSFSPDGQLGKGKDEFNFFQFRTGGFVDLRKTPTLSFFSPLLFFEKKNCC